MNTMKKRLSGAAMSFLALGIIFMSSGAAQAQHFDHNDGRGNRSRWSDERTREYAFAYAYFLAYPQGRDHNHRGGPDYNQRGEYRNGTTGFLGWMGDRNVYRNYFRRGFQLGFREGCDGHNRRFDRNAVERILGASLREVYGRDWRDDDWRDDHHDRFDRNRVIRIAQENGYRDGNRHGQLDRRNRQRHDYNSAEYRNALDGYRREFGDREFYQRMYREGYRRGYDDGFRRGRWDWR
jgi:hypothetical protein